MPRKAATDTAGTETSGAAPRISVIDRRLKQPFGQPSREIPLQGERRSWVVRTFCADPEHPNRHYDAVHRLGWMPIERDDLAVSPESLGYVVTTDGRIVRGPKGEEVLMAMPKRDFDRVQKAKSDANLKGLKATTVRSDVAQAAAKEHGDEAGDQTYANFSQKEFVEPI